jgi:hypothetical protein
LKLDEDELVVSAQDHVPEDGFPDHRGLKLAEVDVAVRERIDLKMASPITGD